MEFVLNFVLEFALEFVLHESLPYPYCAHAILCTMHVFFFGTHIALSLHPDQSWAEALNTDCSRFYAQ